MEKLMNETLVYINYLERKMEMEKTEFGLEQDGSDPRIAVFDELWSKGWITGDPIVVAREMDIPEEYIQSFIEWYVELDDLEYTPWIVKYQGGFSPEYISAMKLEDGEQYLEEEQNIDHIIGEFLVDWFEHHNSLSKSEYEEMKIFHENNPQ